MNHVSVCTRTNLLVKWTFIDEGNVMQRNSPTSRFPSLPVGSCSYLSCAVPLSRASLSVEAHLSKDSIRCSRSKAGRGLGVLPIFSGSKFQPHDFGDNADKSGCLWILTRELVLEMRANHLNLYNVQVRWRGYFWALQVLQKVSSRIEMRYQTVCSYNWWDGGSVGDVIVTS